MEKVLNLTVKYATPDQVRNGLVDLELKDKEMTKKLLTFDEKPDRDFIIHRAKLLSHMAAKYNIRLVLIEGAPFLMPELERRLRVEGITPVYDYSKKEIEEEVFEGEICKVDVFKHIGFIEAL